MTTCILRTDLESISCVLFVVQMVAHSKQATRRPPPPPPPSHRVRVKSKQMNEPNTTRASASSVRPRDAILPSSESEDADLCLV